MISGTSYWRNIDCLHFSSEMSKVIENSGNNFNLFSKIENITRNWVLRSSSLHLSCVVSSGVRSLESLCLQVTDLFPGLRRMQTVLPEHGCLLVSPGNYWQNQRELFDSDPDLFKTIQKHEPKGLHTSATLRGRWHIKFNSVLFILANITTQLSQWVLFR